MDTLILQEYNKYENINFYLTRNSDYIRKGRHETKKQAIEIDNKILSLLKDKQISFETIDGSWHASNHVLEVILKRLNIKQKYRISEI